MSPRPHTPKHPNHPDHALVSEAEAFEPAVTQLRTLGLPELDQFFRSWLDRCGFSQLRRCEPLERAATYHVLADFLPVGIGIRYRIHQRTSRLQVHHVDAFAGHMLRAGVSIGVLITTGEIAPAARRAADSYRSLRLRLYSGREFAAELVDKRLGLRRISLWHWVLDLTRTRLHRFHREGK